MKDCENRYKICRESAGLTQFSAADLLHVSERSLSDYENGKTRVPDDIVATMADVYNSPILAWYHLKYFSPLGKFLPELQEPCTQVDMAFQAILARDELDPAVERIKQIVSAGSVESGDHPAFDECISTMRRVNGKLFSVVAYAETLNAAAFSH